jgi:hypothetical protein
LLLNLLGFENSFESGAVWVWTRNFDGKAFDFAL